ncbi:hypothetical protein EDC94DRAFT_619476 [Helicostylum pulchrum]|nr:hypothetical protein EDC94DRAFT_619476 [Helicostylum pulchrum]
MYKRQQKRNTSSNDKLDDRKNTTKKHPIQLIVSTLPQLAISCAFLFCFISFYNVSLNDVSGTVFLVSLVAGVVICVIFVLLQLGGAQYENWQQEPKTRQYIQIASVCSLVSFIGFISSLWAVFGILTPLVIISGFLCILSILIIATALF